MQLASQRLVYFLFIHISFKSNGFEVFPKTSKRIHHLFFETQPFNKKLEFHFVVTFRDFLTTETLEIQPPK